MSGWPYDVGAVLVIDQLRSKEGCFLWDENLLEMLPVLPLASDVGELLMSIDECRRLWLMSLTDAAEGREGLSWVEARQGEVAEPGGILVRLPETEWD